MLRIGNTILYCSVRYYKQKQAEDSDSDTTFLLETANSVNNPTGSETGTVLYDIEPFESNRRWEGFNSMNLFEMLFKRWKMLIIITLILAAVTIFLLLHFQKEHLYKFQIKNTTTTTTTTENKLVSHFPETKNIAISYYEDNNLTESSPKTSPFSPAGNLTTHPQRITTIPTLIPSTTTSAKKPVSIFGLKCCAESFSDLETLFYNDTETKQLCIQLVSRSKWDKIQMLPRNTQIKRIHV